MERNYNKEARKALDKARGYHVKYGAEDTSDLKDKLGKLRNHYQSKFLNFGKQIGFEPEILERMCRASVLHGVN